MYVAQITKFCGTQRSAETQSLTELTGCDGMRRRLISVMGVVSDTLH